MYLPINPFITVSVDKIHVQLNKNRYTSTEIPMYSASMRYVNSINNQTQNE